MKVNSFDVTASSLMYIKANEIEDGISKIDQVVK